MISPLGSLLMPVTRLLGRQEVRALRGPNLLQNGSFDVDASGWSGQSAALSVAAGKLRVVNSAINGRARSTAFATTPGKRYELVATSGIVSGGLYARLVVWTGAGTWVTQSGSLGVGRQVFRFKATSSSHFVELRHDAYPAEVLWDDASVREVLG